MSDPITNVSASTELDKEAQAVRQAQALAEMNTELRPAGWTTAYPDEILADGWRGIIATKYWAKLWVRYGNIRDPEHKNNHHLFKDLYMNPGDPVTERCQYLFYKRESFPGDASSEYEGLWHIVETNRREDIK